MKSIIIILGLIFGVTVELCAQNTYDLEQFPNGTITVSTLKSTYTAQEIRNMLENVDILRNVKNKSKFGFVFADPVTLENKLVCDDDYVIILFECIKKLKAELAQIKTRLSNANIP